MKDHLDKEEMDVVKDTHQVVAAVDIMVEEVVFM